MTKKKRMYPDIAKMSPGQRGMAGRAESPLIENHCSRCISMSLIPVPSYFITHHTCRYGPSLKSACAARTLSQAWPYLLSRKIRSWRSHKCLKLNTLETESVTSWTLPPPPHPPTKLPLFQVPDLRSSTRNLGIINSHPPFLSNHTSAPPTCTHLSKPLLSPVGSNFWLSPAFFHCFPFSVPPLSSHPCRRPWAVLFSLPRPPRHNPCVHDSHPSDVFVRIWSW